MLLHENLKKFRGQLGMTQEMVARFSGVNYGTYAKIDRGVIRSPRVHTVYMIAKVLGVTIEDLIGEERLTRK